MEAPRKQLSRPKHRESAERISRDLRFCREVQPILEVSSGRHVPGLHDQLHDPDVRCLVRADSDAFKTDLGRSLASSRNRRRFHGLFGRPRLPKGLQAVPAVAELCDLLARLSNRETAAEGARDFRR